jgi:hypothetical protein
MVDEEKIKKAKEVAAQEANTVYGQVIQKMFDEADVGLAEGLHGTSHVHTLILFDKKRSQAVAIRCQWDFTADPEIIKAGIEEAKKQGKIPVDLPEKEETRA